MKGDFSMSEKPQKSYEQAVDQFIRENRYKGQVLYDDLSNQLVVPYSLDADAMDQLIQKVEDSGISVVDENGEPSIHSLKSNQKHAEEEEVDDRDLSAPTGVKINDSIVMADIANTIDYILCFTDKGNYIVLPVHEILEGKWKDEGKHINYICNLPLKESIIKCIIVKNFNIGVTICSVSKLGQIKKTYLSEFYSQRTNKPICCMKLTSADEMVDVCVLHGNSNILIMTKAGKATYFNENDIADTRLKTSGVKCIATLSDSTICSVTPFEIVERCKLLFLTNLGMCKILDSNTLNLRHRLEKCDMLVKSFKTEIHDLIALKKVTNGTDKVVMDCILDNSSNLELTFDDFHVTPLEKYCRKNIDALPDGRKISFIFNFEVEKVDEKTKVENKRARNVSKPTIDDQQVKVVKIDYDGEIEQDLPEESGKVEQISIFDDMGD